MGVSHCGPRLLDLSKMPEHLRFNRFVLTGYRPVSSAWDFPHSGTLDGVPTGGSIVSRTSWTLPVLQAGWPAC
ncbi:hypothetical protein NHX12_025566 [Muraenolepis orangiensis]|uniref:Uncharacterized protein n=1 Tax=Muraenolepis orangiensis TaxID=630683 RepID=A0A9Q0EK79_9TELE|nr:hypothetical protein NHX12_025566 [Muraenolepis orangiensis]